MALVAMIAEIPEGRLARMRTLRQPQSMSAVGGLRTRYIRGETIDWLPRANQGETSVLKSRWVCTPVRVERRMEICGLMGDPDDGARFADDFENFHARRDRIGAAGIEPGDAIMFVV